MSMKINEIKEIFEKTPVDDIPKTAAAFKDDERSGVVKLVERYEKKYAAHLAELERLAEISAFEKGLREKGFRLIAGIDEVGRGPLAGPVMTAAVILPENCVIEGINDSKKLSPAKREALSAVIKEKAVSFAFGSASPEEIEKNHIVRGMADLIIAKHRNGETGRTQLRFKGEYTKFVTPDPSELKELAAQSGKGGKDEEEEKPRPKKRESEEDGGSFSDEDFDLPFGADDFGDEI